MAIEKVVNINVTLKGSQQAIATTSKLSSKLTELNQKTGALGHGMKGTGNAILETATQSSFLNDVTGGLSSTLASVAGNAGLFSKSINVMTGVQKIYTVVVGTTTGALKALRIALVSTGLGAIVVLLGLFISKMMESTESTEDLEKAQASLNDELERSNDLYNEYAKNVDVSTKAQILLARTAGKSQSEIQKIEQEGIKKKRELLLEENKILEQTAYNEKATSEQRKKAIADIYANRKLYNDLGDELALNSLEFDAEVAEAKRAKDKELQDKLLENQRKLNEERLKLEREYQESLKQGLIDFQIATNEAEFEQRRLDIENRQAQSDEIARIAQKEQEQADRDLEAERKRAEERKILEESVANAKVEIADRTLSLIAEIVGRGSAVGKSIAIAQATISGIEGVQNAFTTASKSPITTLFPSYPFIQAGLAGAFSLLQIKKIASTDPSGKTGGGGSASSTGGGGSAPSAPSFNLVAGTGTNQIAEGLAGQRRPLQAYVVSGAVTSAQSLDRNIINDASI